MRSMWTILALVFAAAPAWAQFEPCPLDEEGFSVPCVPPAELDALVPLEVIPGGPIDSVDECPPDANGMYPPDCVPPPVVIVPDYRYATPPPVTPGPPPVTPGPPPTTPGLPPTTPGPPPTTPGPAAMTPGLPATTPGL